jgi:hypothetical protein
MTVRSDAATQIRRAQPGGQRFAAMLQLLANFSEISQNSPQYFADHRHESCRIQTTKKRFVIFEGSQDDGPRRDRAQSCQMD